MKLFSGSLFAVVFALLFAAPAFSQDEEISDEALWKYALLETSVDQMKKDISVTINKMIKDQDGIDGKRYKELAATKGDTEKLTAIEAQDFEIKFLELVSGVKEERIAAIKSVNQELATKMVGDNGKTYKAIKAAIKADESVKTRYSAIKAGLALETEEEDGEAK